MANTADIVVRGVDEELVRRVRADAALKGESFREWVAEACAGRLGVVVGVKPTGGQSGDTAVRGMWGDVRSGGSGPSSTSVRRTRSSKPPSESGAVVGGAQQDRGGEGKSKAGQKCCPDHGKVMVDFGNAWICDGPPKHKELK